MITACVPGRDAVGSASQEPHPPPHLFLVEQGRRNLGPHILKKNFLVLMDIDSNWWGGGLLFRPSTTAPSPLSAVRASDLAWETVRLKPAGDRSTPQKTTGDGQRPQETAKTAGNF